MSFESPSEQNLQELSIERQEKLKAGLGVVLCAKQKEGKVSDLHEQIILAEEMDLPAAQFDFRNRTTEEILAAKEAMVKYRESYPEVAISIHGETPKIDESTLDFKNKARTLGELELLQEFSGESYTVHPPSISSKLFNELPEDTREKILDNYVATFAVGIKSAVEKGKKFTLGIENMPTKGEEGSWGQKVEDILDLIEKVEQLIHELGIGPEISREYVGATLDVNHALHGVAREDYERVLKDWFERLGGYLKVIHLYTPSEPGKEFEEKYRISLDLASQFNPSARLFLETKQSPGVTKSLYATAKSL